MLFLEEQQRLAVLKKLNNLGASDQKEFDDIANLARLICLTNSCLITLVGRDRDFCLSSQGVLEYKDLQSYSICRAAMREGDDITVIPDLSKDPELKNHPAVTGRPHLRFYAGLPLIGRNNLLLGTISVVDNKPGQLTESQEKALAILARRAVNYMEHGKAVIEPRKKTTPTFEYLVREEDKYREIVENSSDLIVTICINGHITYVNKSWVETIGLTHAGEAIGRNVFDFVHASGKEAAMQVFALMQGGAERIRSEFTWASRSGEQIICDANIDCGRIDGKLAFQRGIFRNITNQKRQEIEIKKSQLILAEEQKISHTGTVELNLETGDLNWSDEICNILESNPAGADTFLSSLYGMIIESDQEKADHFMRSVYANPQRSQVEFRIVTPRGNQKVVYCQGSPILVRDGKVVVMLFTLQDVTELKQVERRVFTAVVESEERERTRMAGELHDGVCQYLASAGLMIESLSEKLQQIPEAASNQQIKQLLAHSRHSIKDGLSLVRKVSHDLFPLEFYRSGLIQSITVLVSTLNVAEGILFKLETRGKYIETDPSISINLFRIIQEFTRNSQKYSGASEVIIRINSSPEMVKLTICDNGKGFDLDKLPDNRKGIGLVSMKKRIESIGGSFKYKSSPGAGVELRMKVPLGT